MSSIIQNDKTISNLLLRIDFASNFHRKPLLYLAGFIFFFLLSCVDIYYFISIGKSFGFFFTAGFVFFFALMTYGLIIVIFRFLKRRIFMYLSLEHITRDFFKFTFEPCAFLGIMIVIIPVLPISTSFFCESFIFFIFSFLFFSEFVMMISRKQFTNFYSDDKIITAKTFIRHIFPGLTFKKELNWNANDEGKIILYILQPIYPNNYHIGINPRNYFSSHSIFKMRSFTFEQLMTSQNPENIGRFNLYISNIDFEKDQKNLKSIKLQNVIDYALCINLSFSQLVNIVKSIEAIIPIKFLELKDGFIKRHFDKYNYYILDSEAINSIN